MHRLLQRAQRANCEPGHTPSGGTVAGYISLASKNPGFVVSANNDHPGGAGSRAAGRYRQVELFARLELEFLVLP
jgi:hypothetical protein